MAYEDIIRRQRQLEQECRKLRWRQNLTVVLNGLAILMSVAAILIRLLT